ncbi:MAG: tRNA epoxyqueuosine(34) reductase QueG [Chloroflexota bacterium]
MTSAAEAPGPSLEQSIKDEARRLGFVLAGVTTPDPPPHASVFQDWLSHGRHGSMSYLAEDRSRLRRADPRLIMPECRSIIVLAAPYLNPNRPEGKAAHFKNVHGRGRVAAYAWGQDYHEVIPERLRALVAFIEREVGHKVASRCHTDTAPILERDLAQRAGLGWIGKNTCLINPRLGSYFLLAEILLDVDLKPDAPVYADHCGTCTRCIDACPTGCILSDRTIDARQCISYLTIELKDSIPSELRPRMANWIFGCDICQMVCPWNRFAPPDGDKAFAPGGASPVPLLLQQLQLSDEAFRSQFRETAIRRAKHAGYVRNLIVAAGNEAGPEALPLLQAAAEHGDPLVQEHAAWAIRRITRRGEANE